MPDNDFDKKARLVLEKLADDIEDAHPDIDVDLQGEVLVLTFDNGNQYVINKHGPMKQIWLSSPKSGGWHFNYNEDKDAWVGSKDATINLHHLLFKELDES